jgi:hypothetical protein
MASGIASAPKSGQGPRSADEPTTPLPAQPLGPLPPADQIVVSPRAEGDLEDLGDLDDLGVVDSTTLSHLVSAAMGDTDDDDDALGLSKPHVPTSGPASGIMRPSATPDDDALNLDMMPSNPGGDASLSFVARSDIMKGTDLDDAIATSPMRGFGAPRPASGAGNYPRDGTDIFSAGAPSTAVRTGDSNLLSFLTGPQGESSNILGNDAAGGPTSDLFGDSRVLTEIPSDSSRVSSDILAGSRVSSDILAGSNTSSDILSGSNADSRGSSLFDDPGRATDRLTDPTGSVVSPDQFVPLFDDFVEGSEIVLNKPTVKGPRPSPDLIDDDPGRVSFDIPRKSAKAKAEASDLVDEDTGDGQTGEKTSFMSVSEDEEDAMAAEFLGGADRSGVNLLGAFDHQDTMEGEEEESGDLFSGPTIMDIDLEGASGVNLLEPVGTGSGPSAHKAGRNSELSIFSGPASSARMTPAAEPSGTVTKSGTGPNSPASIFGPDTQGPSSAIFPAAKKGQPGQTDGGIVSFDLPDRPKTSDQTDRLQASSLIDWSKNQTDSDALQQRSQGTDQLSLSGELREAAPADGQLTEVIESDSVFDVQLPSDGSTESQLLKAEMYAKAAAAGAAVAESGIIAGRSGKIPKVEPVSTRSKFVPPPPPPRRTATAWLGGTAAGLLAGVGIAAGAYLGGVVPNKGDNDLAALKTSFESQIQQVTSNAAAEAEKAKQDADLARQQVSVVNQDLKRVKDAEADLRARAATAAQTARAANDAKAAAEKALADARTDAETANAKVVAARDDAAKALALRDELAAKVAAAEMAVKLKSDDLAAAAGRAADAEKTLRAAESTLAAAAKELQTAGLIDASFSPDKAIAALPDAVRKVAAAGSGADGTKLRELADKLVTAQRDAEKANALAAAAKTQADTALAAARKDQAATLAKMEQDLAAARAGGSAEVEKAVAAAGQKYQSQIAELTAALKRDRDERTNEIAKYETRLAAQAEEFRVQLTAARAGLMVAATDAERTAAERASRLFGVGTDAYFTGRYGDAVTALAEATKANPADARAWYYLGLAHWATGDRNAAVEAFKAGGQWEARSATAAKQVGPALERVQGPARFALDAFRP